MIEKYIFKIKKDVLKTDYCEVAFIVDGLEVGRTPDANFTGNFSIESYKFVLYIENELLFS